MSNFLGDENSAGAPIKKWQLIDVGVAPKGLFIFVVVAFMLLIGPVGISYLKVKQKLHYQIWMVPLVSAAACLTLLAYAFFSEGVGTKLRKTVFVELDQDRGTAVTYRWCSIYSALQPRPYQFGDDQFAILENHYLGAPATYRWSDNDYELRGGYASARNVHQIFVAAPIESNSKIVVSSTQGKDSIKLTNRLKDKVKLLVVKSDGKFYVAQDLAPEDSQIISSTTESELFNSPGLRRFFRELLPANTQDYRFSNRSSYSRFSNLPGGRNSVGRRNNFAVDQVIAFSTTVGIKQNLQDGHYIAILDSMSEVPSVVPGSKEIDGRVFVHGKW